ncbi:hypothetical protein ACFTTN_14355 [Streptomyces niveus]|uniref:hypothetical protein n=1 Tax=Streptomyces niveus TaxID=193462 RepID=UPI003630BE33
MQATRHVVTGATVIALVVGVVLGLAGFRERDWPQALGGVALVTLSSTTSMMVFLWLWLGRHEARTRATIADLDSKRRQLDEREARLNRFAQTTQMRITGYSQSYDEALNKLAAERQLRHTLQSELNALSADHNLLIIESLQGSVDTFTRRTLGNASLPYRQRRAGPRTENAGSAAMRRDP